MLTDVQRIGSLGKALDLVGEALIPFVNRQLDTRPPTWRTPLTSLFRDHSQAKDGTFDPENPPWDTYYLLKAVTDHDLWTEVFQFCMIRRVQNYARELFSSRNLLDAHKTPGTSISDIDVLRAVDNARRFLSAIAATRQAQEAERLLTEVVAALPENQRRHAPVTSWSRLVLPAQRTAAIRIVRVEFSSPQVETRGLGAIAWKESFGSIPHFGQNDFVRLELNLDLANTSIIPPLFSLWLVLDAEQITCLCPNRIIAPNSQITGKTFTIPVSGVEEPLTFYGATGHHTVYVLFSKSEFSKAVKEMLRTPQPLAMLDQIAEAITVTDLKVLKAEFVVD